MENSILLEVIQHVESVCRVAFFSTGVKLFAGLRGLQKTGVRYIRSETAHAGHPSPYAPEVGYRYDGLHVVEDYWQAIGKSGFYVWRYRLCKMPHHAAPNPLIAVPTVDDVSHIGGARRLRGDRPQRIR